MGWPRNLILVRHAESEGNVRTVEERAHFETATHNYDITERGRWQARAAKRYLEYHFPPYGGPFDRDANLSLENRRRLIQDPGPRTCLNVRYTSYYIRAKETMKILCPGLKVYEDPRLAEAQRGIWHSMTREEIERFYPGESIRKDREGLYHYRPWGGENWPDVEGRVHSFLGTLTRDYEGLDVLVVVHGHWLLLFQKLLHHLTIEETVARYQNAIFENTSVTQYQSHSDRRRLRRISENIVPWKDPKFLDPTDPEPCENANTAPTSSFTTGRAGT